MSTLTAPSAPPAQQPSPAPGSPLAAPAAVRPLARRGWTAWHFAAAAILSTAAIALTWSAWVDIYHIASLDQEQSHIFLVPIVAAWMVMARRVRLRQCTPAGAWMGPLIVAVGIGMWVVGYHRSIQSVWQMGAVVTVVGAALSALGTQILFKFLPAFAVLLLVVPVPGTIREHIAMPLQRLVAQGTQVVLETFGVLVERSGNLLTINGHDVEVAEACNGMRMVFGLLLVSYAFAFGMPLRNSMRIFILAIGPVVALVCNIIRLAPTVYFFGNTNQEFAETFHDISGWAMLPIAFLILLGIVRLARWALIPVNRYTLAYQ